MRVEKVYDFIVVTPENIFYDNVATIHDYRV